MTDVLNLNDEVWQNFLDGLQADDSNVACES